jgi:steroid delta-isomerase-like uncharacterized protein
VSRSRNLTLIDRFYDDMWNRFDTSVFPQILQPDMTFRGSLGQPVVGFDELSRYVEFVRAFAPDFHNEVVLTITDGDMTFARLSYRGTHRGEVFGVPPTGRRFEYSGAAVFTVRDELISDVWVLGDVYGLLQQLDPRTPVD